MCTRRAHVSLVVVCLHPQDGSAFHNSSSELRMGYNNWTPGRLGTGNCTLMSFGSGQWSDTSCAGGATPVTHLAVCEDVPRPADSQYCSSSMVNSPDECHEEEDCDWPTWGQCTALLQPAAAVVHCACFAYWPAMYDPTCRAAAIAADANTCNQDPKCFWGPTDSTECVNMISSQTGRLVTSGELEDSSDGGIVYLRAPLGTCSALNSRCAPGTFIDEGSHSAFCCALCPYARPRRAQTHSRSPSDTTSARSSRPPCATTLRDRPGTFSHRDATFCTACVPTSRPHPEGLCERPAPTAFCRWARFQRDVCASCVTAALLARLHALQEAAPASAHVIVGCRTRARNACA
jgi:hypothetical protein